MILRFLEYGQNCPEKGAKEIPLNVCMALGVTPWKFNISPENKPSRKESNLQTIIFQGVSENSGFSTQIIHFNRVFHYKLYKPSFFRAELLNFGNCNEM